MERNLIIVDESAIYGGHEAMFLAFLGDILPSLSQLYKIYFVVNVDNVKLISRLKGRAFSSVNVLPVALSRVPLKAIVGFLLPFDYFKLKRVLRGVEPDLVLNIQGTIEIGCTVLWVCKLLTIPVYSYLPITKSSASLGVFLGRLRDFLCRTFYYPIPEKIITISQTNVDELQYLFNVPAERINVVYNFVESNRNEELLDIIPSFDPNKRHLALVGRISNTQKQQKDFFNAWLSKEISDKYVVHIVGDGDDVESLELKMLCTDAERKGKVVFHGWQAPSYVTRVIVQSDALLLPSRFEGVPLVMIEAVQLGKPVIATNVDGMKEFLPALWTFELDDWTSMFECIEEIISGENAELMLAVQERFSVFDMLKNTSDFLDVLR